MIIRSPPNRQRNVSHHGKENCRCIYGPAFKFNRKTSHSHIPVLDVVWSLDAFTYNIMKWFNNYKTYNLNFNR